MWAAVGAVACGILIASLPEGRVSRWAQIALLVALLVGLAATIVGLLSRRRSWPEQREEPIPADPVQMENDRAIANRFGELVSEREMEWLRIETFDGPWRDDRVARLRWLVLFAGTNQGVFDTELAAVVNELTEAARAFLRIYDANTMPDPLTRGAIWRIIGWPGADGEPYVLAEEDLLDIRARLKEAATAVCARYDAFLVISRHKFLPDEIVQRTGRAR